MKSNFFKIFIGLSIVTLISGCGSITSSITNTSSSNTSSSSTTTSSSSSSTSNNEMSTLTISEFINKRDTNNYYYLEGTIRNITNYTYGNFDLVDETGQIYVYGLLSSKNSSNKKEFSSMGLSEGDKIRIAGKYLYYQNSKHEVVDAYFR